MNTIIPLNAKWAFTTRHVNKSDVAGLNADLTNASSGDLVLARVVRVGSHKNLQLADRRNSSLHLDDYVVLCCGNRYAPDQFEGVACINTEKADMLAGGGIIGQMLAKHGSMRNPTQLQPLGLITDAGHNVINISRYALPAKPFTGRMPIVAVTGTAMNSGKTTTAFSLVNGLTKAGLKVAAIKITGTGAFGDFNAFADAGAALVLDFTDAGMATTYKHTVEQILNGAETLFAHAEMQGADIAVVELGDGILQDETWQTLCNLRFQSMVKGLFFAAPDALSAIGALDYLQQAQLKVLGVSGLLTQSPLLCREFSRLRQTTIYTKEQLSMAEVASKLVMAEPLLSSVA